MTIIEQADRIVGIEPVAAACEDRTRMWMRRGAYMEWFVTQDENACSSEFHKRHAFRYRVGEVPIETVAEVVVAVHAATRTRGDGLPEVLEAVSNAGTFGYVYVAKGGGTLDAEEKRLTCDYIRRCLSEPVRRLMAAFDVVSERPDDVSIKVHRVTESDCGLTSWHYDDPPILWLVPKAVKP